VLPRVVLLLAALLAVALVGVYGLSRRLDETACQQNLQRIYKQLVAYDGDQGNLPSLAFFPDDAFTDPDSLYTVLAPYGITAADCVCPAVAKHLPGTGVGYLWNVSLNGRRLGECATNTWMLVEINALSRAVPPPHEGCYHILYADGRVVRVPLPPPGL
jgi:hypothetical protein